MQQFQDITPSISELEILIHTLEKESLSFPEGFLRIDHARKFPRYYWCKSNRPNEPINGFYLSTEQKDLIISLAKKSYYKKALKISNKLLTELKNSKRSEWKESLESLYYNLPEDRRDLLSPLFLSNEDYAGQWSQAPYQTKGGFPENWPITNSVGEMMRSKSEALISDLLREYGIPYRYEPLLVLSRSLKVHPDFQVLNKRTRKEYFWEHLGMMGKDDYRIDSLEKMNHYAQHGYLQGMNILYTFESAEMPLNMGLCRKTIEAFLL